MGTSLYFQVEAATQKSYRAPRWSHFARILLPQDYLLFALLAGVRRDEFPGRELECLPPKGLPDDVTPAALGEDLLTVDDEAAELDFPSTCTRADAEQYVASGASRWLHNGNAITHPDAHSHSWATTDELDTVRARYAAAGGTDGAGLHAAIAMMRSLDGSGLLSRAVFWFV